VVDDSGSVDTELVGKVVDLSAIQASSNELADLSRL
jgi:hypothetical protein